MSEFLPYLVGALVALIVAVPAGYALARLQDRSRLSSAQSRVEEITTQAKRTGENLLKDMELRAKEEQFKKQEAFNREADKERNKLREQEQRLEKRLASEPFP